LPWPASPSGHLPRRTTDEAYYEELKAKIGDRLKDALDTKKYAKTESYALVKKIKDELAAELPADDPAPRRSCRPTTSICASGPSASR
jgi:hypothetical protein